MSPFRAAYFQPPNSIYPFALTLRNATLSELAHGELTAGIRRRKRKARLLASLARHGQNKYLPTCDAHIPDRIVLAVLGPCERPDKCCWDDQPASKACDDGSACGCKLVIHTAHAGELLTRSYTPDVNVAALAALYA